MEVLKKKSIIPSLSDFWQGSVDSAIHERLAVNIISLYALQGMNYIIPMLVLPYLVRVLKMEMYGLIAFAQSFAQYFIVLTDYGFNFSATRAIARSREDKKNISQVFFSVYFVKGALVIIGWIILCAICFYIPRFHARANFFYIAYLAVLGNCLFPVWYFQGIEKMRYISVVIGISKLASAVALFVFVHRPEDALLALGIQSGATVLGGVLGVWLALRSESISKILPGLDDIKAVIKEGWHLFVSTAAVSLYTNTNVFLVGILAGNVQAGYFSAAEKLIRAMQGVIAPISQALFPHMNSLANDSREQALHFASKTLRWMTSLTLPASVALLIFARPIATICFGGAGLDTAPIIRWIAFLPFLVAISNVLGIQTMISFGLDRQFSRILIVAGLVNVLLAIPLIRQIGAKGAGAAVLLTECLVTALMLIVLRRHNLRIKLLEGLWL